MKNSEKSQKSVESSSDTENGGVEIHELVNDMTDEQIGQFVDALFDRMRKQDASESPEES